LRHIVYTRLHVDSIFHIRSRQAGTPHLRTMWLAAVTCFFCPFTYSLRKISHRASTNINNLQRVQNSIAFSVK